MAAQLRIKMEAIAKTLYNYHYNNRTKYSNDKTGNNKYNTALNNSVKSWNKLHRGQYLTIESRGFSVKVPYYQFPLIFGDCFGSQGSLGYDPYVGKDKPIEARNRSFKSSIASSKFDKVRWNTEASNLVFFRLFGGVPWASYSSSGYDKAYDKFLTWKKVKEDYFYTDQSLMKITSMPLKVYRVDSYNISNGKYYYKKRGAASTSSYGNSFTERTIDPIKDNNSIAKGNAYEWLKDSNIGTPTVKCNDSEVEDSFDKDKK